MLRLAELSLFLAPLAAYLLWRRTFARGVPPSWPMLGATLAGLLLFGAGLAWFGVSERLPPGTRYVPPRLIDGQIVPGHGG